MANKYTNYFVLPILLVLGCSVSSSLGAKAVDLCYDYNHSNYGVIGNCIPATACTTNVTVPSQCPSFDSNYVCCFDENLPGRELRGAWIATVDNIDWPISRTDSVAKQQTDIKFLIDQLERAGFNAIYMQVRPAGDALYNSPIEPWSEYLTGTQGQAPSPVWDPLEYIIEYSHSKSIEVHAWINPYRAALRPSYAGLAPNHMANEFRQFAYIYGTYVWMDPGAPQVQNRTYSVCLDLVDRYDLDGMHMDDYFYPYPVAGVAFPDAPVYAEYLAGGGSLSLADWRRDNVNRLVERLNVGLHEVKPWIKFSISPFGLYRPGEPEGMPSPIAGFDQYSQLYADPKLWLVNAWVDVMIPQLYWRIAPPAQSYPVLLNWWVQQNPQNRHVYAGNYLSKYLEDPAGWPLGEFMAQVGISREQQSRSRGSWGNVQFSAKVFRDNVVVDYFRNNIYKYPAYQPPFDWLPSKPNKQDNEKELG